MFSAFNENNLDIHISIIKVLILFKTNLSNLPTMLS